MLTLGILLTGCEASFKGFPDRPQSIIDDLAALRSHQRERALQAYYSGSPEERTRYRNEIVYAHMATIDRAFNDFQQDVTTEAVGTNIGTDAANIGLGAAGAVVSGGASQIMSAISGGITGLKGSVEKNLFFEQTMPALISKMHSQRRIVKANIVNKLTNTDAEYPLGAALSDLEDYYFAGTVPGAITSIFKNAGVETEQANTILLPVLTSEFIGLPTAERRDRILNGINEIGSRDRAFELVESPPGGINEQMETLKAQIPHDSLENAKTLLSIWITTEAIPVGNYGRWEEALGIR